MIDPADYPAGELAACAGSCYSEFEEGRACTAHGRPAPTTARVDDDDDAMPDECEVDDVGDGGVTENYYSSDRMYDAGRID